MKGISDMKGINIKMLFKSKSSGNVIILVASIVLIYLMGSAYFAQHFFPGTVINGVNVSLKAHSAAERTIRSFVKDYRLQLIERKGEVEEIIGQDIGMQYNEKVGIAEVLQWQKPFKWISFLISEQEYHIDDLIVYDKAALENKIKELKCLKGKVIEPQNVSFRYNDGSYEIIEEVFGNKINLDKLKNAIELYIFKGETKLNLEDKLCYYNPRYTTNSEKTSKTKELLNKYASANITYMFGSESEVLDGSKINQWLSVDENLEVVVDEVAAMKYVRVLGKKHDTVGVARNFRTSTGKVIEVKGGLYGWKIDQEAEIKALIENIKHGEVLDKEPVYAQKAWYRSGNEIGSTYVEINITKQHLWFYKNGRIITQGAVVTGNPSRGFSTVLGTYMLNYKDKGAVLSGPDYEAPVTYWMPFFGNIGIHDATWRHSFGGQIYKTRGSHGCVNAPFYLAKAIFENIEEGTPIICYEESGN